MVPIVGARGKDKVWGIEFGNDAAVSVGSKTGSRLSAAGNCGATSPVGIAVNWGPCHHAPRYGGPGISVSWNKDFAIGALSLGISTDGNDAPPVFAMRETRRHADALSTIDHTRPVRFAITATSSLRQQRRRTVGRAIALLGRRRPGQRPRVGSRGEIVRAEGLPYQANRRRVGQEIAARMSRPSGSITTTPLLTPGSRPPRVTGIRVLSRYNCFGNWGHFEPDLVAFKLDGKA